jgi:hypothetical protein
MSSEFKVAIVGCGISGLCLAQGLKRKGINFHLYDRDPPARPAIKAIASPLMKTGSKHSKLVFPSICSISSRQPVVSQEASSAFYEATSAKSIALISPRSPTPQISTSVVKSTGPFYAKSCLPALRETSASERLVPEWRTMRTTPPWILAMEPQSVRTWLSAQTEQARWSGKQWGKVSRRH